MYDLIEAIIDHVWNTGTNYNTTEQQIIYTTACFLIVIFSIVLIDLVYRLINSILRKGGK